MEDNLLSKSAIQKEFKDKILFSAKDEREFMIKQLSEKIYRFLQTERIINSVKYDQVISEVIEDSVAYTQDWSPAKASDAFLSLMKYVLNMLDQPYKKTYWTLRTYSGYYFLKIRQYLRQPDRILFLIGYEMRDDFTLQLSYSKLVDVETRIKVACDCLVASSECRIISTIWDSLCSLGYTLKDIVHCRKVFCTSTDKTVLWIKQNLPITKPSEKDIDDYRNEENKQSKKNVDTTGYREQDLAKITEQQTEQISATDTGIKAKTQSQITRHTTNGSRTAVGSVNSVSYKQSKPSPPGHLLEGTNEEHMEASFLATEKLSARGPDIVTVTQADNFTQSLWSTKDIESDRILNNGKPLDVYSHDTHDRFVQTQPRMTRNHIPAQTTTKAQPANLSKSINDYPVGTVYSTRNSKDVQTISACQGSLSPTTDSSLPVSNHNKLSLSGRSDLFGSHIATSRSTPMVNSQPGGQNLSGNTRLQISGGTGNMATEKVNKPVIEQTRRKNKSEPFYDQLDRISLRDRKTTWKCEACTYENDSHQVKCEMCGREFATMV